jgi:hypothetical protein
MFERLPNLRLDAGAQAPRGLVFRKPESLPAVWEPVKSP